MTWRWGGWVGEGEQHCQASVVWAVWAQGWGESQMVSQVWLLLLWRPLVLLWRLLLCGGATCSMHSAKILWHLTVCCIQRCVLRLKRDIIKK